MIEISNLTKFGPDEIQILHRNDSIDREHEMSGSAISAWSKALMRDRNTGDFDNYGSRLYAEALHDLEKKKTVVRISTWSDLCCFN